MTGCLKVIITVIIFDLSVTVRPIVFANCVTVNPVTVVHAGRNRLAVGGLRAGSVFLPAVCAGEKGMEELFTTALHLEDKHANLCSILFLPLMRVL